MPGSKHIKYVTIAGIFLVRLAPADAQIQWPPYEYAPQPNVSGGWPTYQYPPSPSSYGYPSVPP
ncbi:MAG: hypothetical protein AB7T18_08595, partial [Alphaproteobacteria bacterium]